MNIYITRDGEQHGPYPRESAFAYLKDGSLTAEDLAWREGMEERKPLKEVLGGVRLRPLDLTPAPVTATRFEPARVELAGVASQAAAPVRRQAKQSMDRGTDGGRLWKVAAVSAAFGLAACCWQFSGGVKGWIAGGQQILAEKTPKGDAPETAREETAAATESEGAAESVALESSSRAEEQPGETPVQEAPVNVAPMAKTREEWPQKLVLKVSAADGDQVTVESQGGTATIAAAPTDLAERVRPAGASALPKSAQPGQAAAPVPVPAGLSATASSSSDEELPGLGVQPASYFPNRPR